MSFKALQKKLKITIEKHLINKTAKVLFENRIKKSNKYFGRDEYFNSVIVESNKDLTGMIKNIKIQNGNQNTLFGEIVTNDNKNQLCCLAKCQR